jgi:hypothetical protein
MRKLAPTLLLSALLFFTGTVQAVDVRESASLNYDALLIADSQPPADKMAGYKELKKIIAGKASFLFQKYLGESYWTKKVAPILLNSLYSTVVANASGQLNLKSPSSVLDHTANRLAASGKEELTTLSREKLPDLPLVGNMVGDLAESQHISLRSGKVNYRMKMRKRFAPAFKLGQFSFSGGTEAYLVGTSFSKKSVASIGYKDEDNSYRVQLHGNNVRFDADLSPVNLRLDWNPEIIKFNLNLNVGSWL